jgi:hypothetical protein
MKVVFAGPSLAGSQSRGDSPTVEFRSPAALGDITKAVLEGATVIGLVDGVFENVAAVWHKEILYALSEGVAVFGAASMGALRAAECAPYGMIGVGTIYAAYASGEIVDDDAVAQVHGPEELDYVALSEPLVNIEATIDVLQRRHLLTTDEVLLLRTTAREMFFKERTYENILAAVTLPSDRLADIAVSIRGCRRDLKGEEAELLVAHVAAAPDRRLTPPAHWQFQETSIWRELLDRWKSEPPSRRPEAGQPPVAESSHFSSVTFP